MSINRLGKYVAGFVLLAGTATLGASATSAGALYLTDGDSQRLAILDTDTGILSETATHFRGSMIAVRDTIWIGVENGAAPVTEYDLAGNPTGNTSPTPILTGALDGAANGNTNYTVSNGGVYSFNEDWTNPVYLFSALNEGGMDGITYDSVNESLWISGENHIFEFDLTGSLRSSFSHGRSGSVGLGGLAYDQSTDRIWLVDNVGAGMVEIYTYNKTGILTEAFAIFGLASDRYLGAEFAVSVSSIPEPGALFIFGLGFAALGFARLKRVS